MNGIQVYQNNTLLLSVELSTTSQIDLVTYTPMFKLYTGSTASVEVCGTTSTSSGITTASFTIPATDNNLTPRVYEYEVYITNGTNTFTVINDSYTILPIVE